MSYNQFLEEIRVAVQEILGRGYNIQIQQIRKNNGVLLDGLIIGKAKKQCCTYHLFKFLLYGLLSGKINR